MQAVFNVALPVFALILAGFIAARLKLLGPASSEALNKFVYYFALPALLFLVMFRVPLASVADREFLFAYVGPIGVVLVVTAIVGRLVWGLRPSDLAVQTMTAIYGNVGYMGIPLCLMTFGDAGLPMAIAATIITGSIMFGLGVMVIEADLRSGAGLLKAALGVIKVVSRNPLLIAPILGAVWASSGVGLPVPIKSFLDLMGAAASPCALFALGLFLAGQPLRSDLPPVTWLVFLKLVAMPALTMLFIWLDSGDQPLTLAQQVALLLNALPTGAGSFVLAQQYNRLVAQTSGAILISTVQSVLSVSFLVAIFAIK